MTSSSFRRTMMNAFARRVNLAGAIGAIGALLLAGAAAAEDAAPRTKPILTVSGKSTGADNDGVVQFDRDALEALGTVAFETHTPWYKGPVKFEGVQLQKLMEK